MVTLTNPLTTEERLSTTRIIDHDLIELITSSKGNIESSLKGFSKLAQETYERTDALTRLLFCIRHLTNSDEFVFKETRAYSDKINEKEIQNWITNINGIGSDKFSGEIRKPKAFLSDRDILYSAVWQLLRNSFIHSYSDSINLIVENTAFPDNPIFIPEGARDYDKFVAFRVCDTGKGFPQDKNWQEYFTRCPPKGGNGFGLYFTGLVAKVLRAPVEIQSVPGNTRVSFYHPIYPEDKV